MVGVSYGACYEGGLVGTRDGFLANRESLVEGDDDVGEAICLESTLGVQTASMRWYHRAERIVLPRTCLWKACLSQTAAATTQIVSSRVGLW